MAQEQQPRRYTREEVGDLIETASKLEWAAATSSPSDVSLDELKSIASEMGISDQALAAALAKQEQEDEKADALRREREAEERAREKRVKAAWTAWRTHIAVYVAVLLGLFVIDLMTGPGLWVQWPAAGWGIGLLAHTGVMLVNKGDVPE